MNKTNNIFSIDLLKDESWWGGFVTEGNRMPYGSTNVEYDLFGTCAGNQAVSHLVSSKGRSVISKKPFRFSFHDGKMTVQSNFPDVHVERNGNSLRESFLHLSKNYFPPTGGYPAKELFTAPQFNTWMEMTYFPTEDKVLDYAKSIIGNGFKPGVLMIDEGWQEYYGLWDFHPGRFKNPKRMIDSLHEMGFKVMVWVCPYIVPDSNIFRSLLENKIDLIQTKNANGVIEPAIKQWWNGYSAVLDLSSKKTHAWFYDTLCNLMTKYGVDGFKFDGGESELYGANDISVQNVSPNEQSELYGLFGAQFPFNEFRSTFNCGGQPLAQRLRDKLITWEECGIKSLIADGLAQSLMGFPFSCPDMIGGGDAIELKNLTSIDQELFVRFAQCSALFPMMQFSMAPWRVLDNDHLDIVKKTAELHVSFAGYIIKNVEHASLTGEPIVRHMEYLYPNTNFHSITDQFMLGDDFLVAPVITKGAVSRNVVFPEGEWIDEFGNTHTGNTSKLINAPIDRLPWFRRKRII